MDALLTGIQLRFSHLSSRLDQPVNRQYFAISTPIISLSPMTGLLLHEWRHERRKMTADDRGTEILVIVKGDTDAAPSWWVGIGGR